MDERMLEVVRLTKTFGGLTAVSELSFTVEKGQIKAIIGPNGAGKTTCLNVISGIYRPTSGEIKFMGRAITGLTPHERAYLGMGRTFQNIRLFTQGMRVLENVMTGRHIRTKTGIFNVLFRWGKTSRSGRVITSKPRTSLTPLCPGLLSKRIRTKPKCRRRGTCRPYG